MKYQYPSWEEITKIRETFREAYWAYWINDNLFSFGWWLLLVLHILFIYLASKLLDRTRLFELLTVGGLAAIFSTLIDIITIQYGLTGYPTSLSPLSPSLFVSSLIILPVIYMLLYQFFSTWKSFILANLVVGAFLAFLGENLFRWLNIYQYIQWNSFYSLITYLGIGIVLKWILSNLLKAQKKQ
ncbi:CBO0543 family protein [Halalkalibacter lacteus]|uniref:CBO0543 family protein n=1 Tax=Halalkalibacter lacteus TaxID=3090663 RepID=UPI002FCB005B